MAIADTITSMQTHTSNAYTMIGYGTDLTGINKNLENLSSTIFEAFLEALRNPDTLFNNLPKTSGSGSNITLNGTANAPMRITLNPTAITQDGTPTPSSPQDIHTISGNNSVVVEGKNLLTLDNYVLISGYDIVINNPLKEETTYIVSCVNDYPVANKGVALSFTNTLTNMTENGYFCGYVLGKDQKSVAHLMTTAQVNSKYMVVRSSETADIPKLNSMKMQLELGNTPTTYTPYVSQTNPINLGEIEYCKIGSYEDRIFKNVVGDTDYSSERDNGGWYIKKNIGKVVLDGTENWEERTNSGGVKQFFCPTTLTDVLLGADNTQLCNYAKFNRSTFNWGAVGDFSILDNTKRFYICVNSNAVLNDFKTTISSNNIIAYVQQATPTYTKITGELANQLEQVYKNMLSYDGTTNISQVNNDLAFVINASGITK